MLSDKNICEVSTRLLSKQELIDLINRNFENENFGNIALLTMLKNSNNEVKQSLTFSKNLEL